MTVGCALEPRFNERKRGRRSAPFPRVGRTFLSSLKCPLTLPAHGDADAPEAQEHHCPSSWLEHVTRRRRIIETTAQRAGEIGDVRGLHRIVIVKSVGRGPRHAIRRRLETTCDFEAPKYQQKRVSSRNKGVISQGERTTSEVRERQDQTRL